MIDLDGDPELNQELKRFSASLVKSVLDMTAAGDRAEAELLISETLFELTKSIARGCKSTMVSAHVREFHRVFEQPILEKPTVPSEERLRLRGRLITEEPLETLLALGAEVALVEKAEQAVSAAVDSIRRERCNIVAVADGLTDSDWMNEGTRLEFGINGGPVNMEVYRSNMSKLGPDGKPVKRADGKVIKPDGWTPPDIARVLREQGWKEQQ